MKCNLCLGELTDSNRCEAHILPRGLLKEMAADEYGKLLIVGTDMDKKRRAPTGSYDNNILCRDCDGKFGEYDKYALSFVRDSKLIPHSSGRFWIVKGVEHAKLKLFCMSYIWRASITERPEFAGVDLGTKHQEKLRRLLYAGDPGSANDYTTVFAKFENVDDKIGGVLFPARTRIRGLTYYEAYLPRLYKFWVKIDSQNDDPMSKFSLGDQEDMFVHNRGDFDSSIEKSILVRAAHSSQ